MVEWFSGSNKMLREALSKGSWERLIGTEAGKDELARSRGQIRHWCPADRATRLI